MFKKMKLTSRITLMIALMVAVTIAILFAIGHGAIRPLVQVQVESSITSEAENMASELDKWFYAFIHITDSMALSLNHVQRERMEDLVADFRDSHPDITLTWIGFEDGHAYSGNRVAPPWSDAYNRPWYINAVRAGGRSVINLPHFSAAEQVWVTSTSRLLPNVDGMEGAAALIITLDSMLNILYSFDIAGGGYAFIVGPNGEVIAHPDSNYAPTDSLKNIADIDIYSSLANNILQGGNFVPLTSSTGVSSLLSSTMLPTSGWMMVSVIPETVITAGTNRLLTIILSVIFAVLLALSGGIILVIRKSLSPLRILTKNVRDVANGDFNFNKITTTEDEIGLLTEDVYNFVEVIKTLNSDIVEFARVSAEDGDYDYKMDETKYKGEFKVLAERINKISKGSSQEALISLQALNNIANGVFKMDVPVLPGKRGYTTDVINKVLDALDSLSSDMALMIEAASVKGDLSVRINADRHQGDWQKIIHGLNSIAIAVDEPLKLIDVVIEEMKLGNLNSDSVDAKVNSLGYEVDPSKYNGVFKTIIGHLEDTFVEISEYINEIAKDVRLIADGDLSTNITREFLGDFAPIKEGLNDLSKNLNKTMTEIAVASDQVLAGASQISNSSAELSNGAQEQSSSMQELNSSVELINQQTRQNADNATMANELSNKSAANATEGNDAMQQMVEAMNAIKESSSNIGQIVKTIQDIAFQTNLLALNASVEAARAGEHGKGFAVVADEVRSLAGRSQTAATETTTLIQDSINRVETGGTIAESTSEQLNAIVSSVDEVLAVISSISTASKEQAASIEQISEGLAQISKVTQSNSAVSEETAAAAEELNGQAETLRQLVAFFKL